MFFRKKYLLAKIEVTYNTDPGPANTDAIQTTNLTINPYEGNRVSRDLDRDYLGGQEEINTGPMTSLEFDVEIAGAGALGDVPGYGTLLRACGMAEAISVGVEVVYTPVSASFESVTLHFWLDGQLHTVTGARGSVSFQMNREEIPVMRFRFDGNYNSPSAGATVNPDFTTFVDPLAVIDVNTNLTFFGQAVKTEQLSMDLANNIVPRFLINGDEIIISDRDPSGTIQFEAQDLGTYDFFNDIEAHAGTSLGALQVVHGTIGGNIVQIDAPACQIGQMGVQDSDGIVAYNMNLNIIPTASGNDEMSVTVK